MAGPLYPQSETSEDGVASTANSNTDGVTGTYTTLATGTASGKKQITEIEYFGPGTLTAGYLRFFIHDGTTAQMIAEIPVPPWTPRVALPAVPKWRGKITFKKPKPLPSTSYTLKFSTENAEAFNALATSREFV